jgi:hypothetical protein
MRAAEIWILGAIAGRHTPVRFQADIAVSPQFEVGQLACRRLVAGRDFPAATRDSCLYLPFPSDFLESPPITVEPGLFPTERLPALHNHVHILRV